MVEDGNPPPKLLFFTSVKDVRLFNEEKRPSGRADIPVDSRCRANIDVKFVKELGRLPPGTCPSPISCKLVRPVRAPTASGMDAGTAGNWSPLVIRRKLVSVSNARTLLL